MNKDQAMSLLRTALKVTGAALVTYSATTGIDAAMWEAISGAVLLVAPVVWDMFQHTESAAVAKVASLGTTDVTKGGQVINILDPKLARVAKEAATPVMPQQNAA